MLVNYHHDPSARAEGWERVLVDAKLGIWVIHTQMKNKRSMIVR